VNTRESLIYGSSIILEGCLSGPLHPPTLLSTSKSDDVTATATWEIGNGRSLVVHLNLDFDRASGPQIHVAVFDVTPSDPGDAT
jgi:hypothetical protein